MENSQSLNRYCYVQGNPVSFIDPFGLSPIQALYSNNNFDHIVLSLASCIPFVGYIPATINANLYAKEGDVTKQLMWECIAGAQLFAPFGSPIITGGFLAGAGFFTYCDGYEEMQSSWEQYFDNCLEQGKSPWQKDLTAYKDVILPTFECFMGGLLMMNGGLAVADGIRELRAAAEMRKAVTESTNVAEREIVEVSEGERK